MCFPGEYLQCVFQAKTFVFDKTGTLTVGKPRVVHVVMCHPERTAGAGGVQGVHTGGAGGVRGVVPIGQLAGWLFLTESNSEHPIANSIVRFAQAVSLLFQFSPLHSTSLLNFSPLHSTSLLDFCYASKYIQRTKNLFNFRFLCFFLQTLLCLWPAIF